MKSYLCATPWLSKKASRTVNTMEVWVVMMLDGPSLIVETNKAAEFEHGGFHGRSGPSLLVALPWLARLTFSFFLS